MDLLRAKQIGSQIDKQLQRGRRFGEHLKREEERMDFCESFEKSLNGSDLFNGYILIRKRGVWHWARVTKKLLRKNLAEVLSEGEVI